MAAIEVTGLSKRYRINHAEVARAGQYRTLRESLVRFAKTGWKNLSSGAALGEVEDFWAIRDISFEVQPGEVVGIIGRNGAGKSTLLKILTRITEPTSGQALILGRVGSLLEVGTGFHPELTGRENVFLNGSILGMARREIKRNFDEIVAFSGVERFIDTPVKRYSSGMKVRLAFSIAAHLDLEVMLVDEVLAVGDADFQRKCLQRLREVTQGGRTVVFVSHNMPAVESLCDRAILLSGGTVAAIGNVDSIIQRYYQQNRSHGNSLGFVRSSADGGGAPQIIRNAALLDSTGTPTDHLLLGRVLCIRIGLESLHPINSPTVCIGIDDSLGQRVLTLNTPLSHECIPVLRGQIEVECRVPECPLSPGDYSAKIAIGTNQETLDAVEQALFFSVEDAELFDEGRGFHRGSCVARSRWEVIGPG